LQSLSSALLADAIKGMAAAEVIGLAIVVVVPFQEKLITRLIARMPLPSNIGHKVSEQVDRFLMGMRSMHNTRRLVKFLFC